MIPNPSYPSTQNHFGTHRSWSTVNGWNASFDEWQAESRPSSLPGFNFVNLQGYPQELTWRHAGPTLATRRTSGHATR